VRLLASVIAASKEFGNAVSACASDATNLSVLVIFEDADRIAVAAL